MSAVNALQSLLSADLPVTLPWVAGSALAAVMALPAAFYVFALAVGVIVARGVER